MRLMLKGANLRMAVSRNQVDADGVLDVVLVKICLEIETGIAKRPARLTGDESLFFFLQ
jgi:hypothetical protein